jgi:hypothetical protein
VFPQIQGTPAQFASPASGLSHALTLPTGIVSGELHLCLLTVRLQVATTDVTIEGWTQLTAATQGQAYAFYREDAPLCSLAR